MPVDFLTAGQRARYGRYGEEPTPGQLARCFHLTNDDREFLDKGKSDRARLGGALQLGTVRFLGTFLADQTDVPIVVVDHLATQLGISDPSAVKGYNESAMRFKHAAAIRKRFGYRDFTDQPLHMSFVRWLYTRAFIGGERHIVLFDLSTIRMVEAKVLLPAASTLERLVASVKERAAVQLWRTLGAVPDAETKARLLALLVVRPGRRRLSALDRLRRAPTSPSIDGLVGGLRRLEEIQTLGAWRLDLGRAPRGRVDDMARYVPKAKAAEIERMPAERRIAHLVAYAATLQGSAIDDVLTILDDVVGGLLSRVERKGKRRRLWTLGDLDRAALALREAWFELKAAAEDPEADLRATVVRLAVERVDQAAATVAELARPPDDRYFEDLPSRYSHVRRFLPYLLRLVTYEGTDAAEPVLAAWHFLRRQEVERPKPRWVDAPLEVASGVWRPVVEPKPGQVDHRAYTLCVLERLRDAMRKRDVFVKASRRWRDPREQLLAGNGPLTARERKVAWQLSETNIGTDSYASLLNRRELGRRHKRPRGCRIPLCRSRRRHAGHRGRLAITPAREGSAGNSHPRIVELCDASFRLS